MNKEPPKNLLAWQKGMDLVMDIYKITDGFPKTEIYSLMSQMKRCAISIVSNISEGSAYKSNLKYSYFLSISLGSIKELDTQLEIAYRLKYLDEIQFKKIQNDLSEVGGLIFGLKRSIDLKSNKPK